MRKALFTLILLLFSLPLLAQTLPDSAKAANSTLPQEKPAAVKAGKAAPPEAKPVAAKPPKPLPRVVVLDFVNAAGAPARLGKSVAERMRFYLLKTGLCRVVDAGETGTAITELGIARSDSAGREQLALLAQKLKADYIITGLISDYREGDIEFKKHKIELMGKLLWGNNGELCAMEAVKVKAGGEMHDVSNRAAEELGIKLVEKIK